MKTRLWLPVTVLLLASGCESPPPTSSAPTPPVAAKLAFVVQPGNTNAGQVISPAIVVAIQDALGNTVTTATGAVTVALGSSPSGAILSGTTTMNAVNGVATFGDLSVDRAGTGYTLTASLGALTGARSASFVLAAARLAFVVQPAGALAEGVISPAVVVAIQDAAGKTVTNATGAVTVALDANPPGATLSGTTTVSAVNGVATFENLSIDKIGTYTLRASFGSSGAYSSPFSIRPLTKLAFVVQPGKATAGEPISPAVVVAIQDSSGNTLTSATSAVTVALRFNPGGTLAGTTTVNAVNGMATFSNLSIGRADTGYSLMASSSTSAQAYSAAFSVTPGAPAKLAFVVSPGTIDVAEPFAPQVAVQDALGNTVVNATSSVSLALDANPGGATLIGTLTVPAFRGVARFGNLSLDLPGAGYTLAATSESLTGATSGPFTVQAPGAFAAVSAGSAHTCGVTKSGLLYCWGANANGQVGEGTTASRTTPVLVSASIGQNLGELSAGGSHTCGDGFFGGSGSYPSSSFFYAFCWGLNDQGQVGDGTTIQRTSPVYIGGTLGLHALSLGANHTCGLATVTYCWGANTNGQLGDGTTTPRMNPVRVAGSVIFAVVSAGVSHTCGLTGPGAAYCWGLNDNGQVGDGTTTQRTQPVPVAGGLTFDSLSAGGRHACGLTTAGVAYCWGANDSGQLGDGTTTQRTGPAPVAGGLTFASLSAGGNHTCGVVIAVGTYCWGANDHGQLGIGTTADSVVPVKVAGQ